jgi:ribosomal protein L37E
MRTKYRYCGSVKCPSGAKEVEHEILSVGTPDPGMTAPHFQLKCKTCGHESWEVIPKRRCHKRVWPYHNESVGVTFESESHEQKYVKANNLSPA